MQTFISKDLFLDSKGTVVQRVLEVANLKSQYISNRNDINEHLTIGSILSAINSHIDPGYHIYSMKMEGPKWSVESTISKVTNKTLVNALWKSCLYAYDEEARKKELEEKQKVWRNNEELVYIKNSIRGI